MFYRMISQNRDEWFASPDCTIAGLISYMEANGHLRDAQIDAIKTYLYLKIACGCKPLVDLFCRGAFNSMNLEEQELSVSTRSFLSSTPAAAALYEYALMKDDKGQFTSEKLATAIKENPHSIDYARVFRDIFSNVSYTDYLFSLPMGAGKTYLMAAFIYLDLYFAQNEPANPAFAHNFIIFAPSGLKSSVVPSLKTIQNFDPTWVLPEPAASQIKRRLLFEVLDAQKTSKKSNKVNNPNVQKLARHQPLSDLFGLIAVVNAEKVILDSEKQKAELTLFDDAEMQDKKANELRYYISRIPRLSVFVDEVHHATSDEIKLRQVITRWMKEGDHTNSVIGFSGTPYRSSKVAITPTLTIGFVEIPTIVCYYPLIEGIGNFLKRPVVRIAENMTSLQIIEKGVRDFLDTHLNTVYEGGLTAKLGIYCGTIPKCEKLVYPLVTSIVREYGLPETSVLKYHDGNKEFPAPADGQMEFDILDKSISKKRIVLLVQIGKEGWDCRSLTGVILSQESACPRNNVLQTSCRCLRQVEKDHYETALIWLNKENAEVLNAQLEQQQHISLQEFQTGSDRFIELKRYDRTKYLKLPKVDFYQLRVRYETKIVEPANPAKALLQATTGSELDRASVASTDFSMEVLHREFDKAEHGMEHASFHAWLYSIRRDSLGTLTAEQLKPHEAALRKLFDAITYERDGERYFSSHFDRSVVEANVRKAFCDERRFETIEEKISQQASLLRVENFKTTVQTNHPEDYYPEQQTVKNIIDDDRGKFKVNPEVEATIRNLLEMGMTDAAEQVRARNMSHPQKDRSFHYLPYHTDSDFEIKVLKDLLAEDRLEPLGLEVYYNGDRGLTEFKIACYQSSGGAWHYIGKYTPDFLIIQRKNGAIHKAIITETKGSIFAKEERFLEKRHFVENKFIPFNNDLFGYKRFDYLYLEDSMSDAQRQILIHVRLCEFFGEGAL